VQESAAERADGGGRGEAAEGASCGEHGGFAGERETRGAGRIEGLGVFGSWV
jgi:hypothetical protein